MYKMLKKEILLKGLAVLSGICLIITFSLFNACVDSDSLSPVWQTISGDFQRTGQRAIDVQVNGPVQADWKFSIQQLGHPPSSPCPPPYNTPDYDKEIIYSSPAISRDGKVFFGSVMDCPVQSGFNAGDGWFYALDQYTGELLWTQNMHGWVESSPALSHDNSVVYVGSKSGMLTAMDTETGDKIWEFPTGAGITSSPAIDSEGTIYIGSLDGSLYAVRPDGTLKWSYDDVPTDGSIHSSPALSQDESTVYFGHAVVCGGPGQDPCPDPSPDYSLIAVDTATGTFIWEFPIEGHVWGSAMVSPYDGSILFPTFHLTGDNYLYSVSPAGVENWRYQMDSFSNGIPSIGPDGTVYIGEFIGGPTTSLYAINPDGTLKWQFELAGNINYQSSVVLINGGDTVVFGTYTKEVYALDADDMSIQWIYTAEGMVQASVAVSPDGHLFFGDWNGVQYSIGGKETRIEAIPTTSE
jgi:outer membrane protein assembly factor BamB